jgi:PAS domain S-box-containing protein
VSTEHGQGLMPPAELRLPPRAESVREARRFLRSLLHAADRERWTDAAELALSEVVTNGVLHAHTELTVRLAVLDEVLRVEVSDGNPTLPVQRGGQSAEATTGRGLELVAALTLDCGVRPEPTGKVVWFIVGDEEPEHPAEDELLAAWDDTAWEPDGGWEPAPPPDQRQAVLLRMPTTLWLAAREHHQALLRELVLYAAEHEETAALLPDLALTDQARHLIWTALLAEIDRSRAEGTARRPVPHGHRTRLPDVPESVDLPLLVTPGLAAAFAALQDALDVGERLAVADRLLVRPGLPEIVAVRDWACEQVVAQLAGVPPAPWPGTDQSHFVELVHDRAEPDEPQWDSSVVTQSDRGVAAADDANRLLAVSAPLARATGWEPADLVGRRVVALIPPELREAHVAGFSRHLTTGEAQVLGVPLELPVLHRDGSSVRCTFLLERAVVGSGRPVYLAWIEPVEPGQ